MANKETAGKEKGLKEFRELLSVIRLNDHRMQRDQRYAKRNHEPYSTDATHIKRILKTLVKPDNMKIMFAYLYRNTLNRQLCKEAVYVLDFLNRLECHILKQFSHDVVSYVPSCLIMWNKGGNYCFKTIERGVRLLVTFAADVMKVYNNINCLYRHETVCYALVDVFRTSKDGEFQELILQVMVSLVTHYHVNVASQSIAATKNYPGIIWIIERTLDPNRSYGFLQSGCTIFTELKKAGYNHYNILFAASLVEKIMQISVLYPDMEEATAYLADYTLYINSH